MLLDYNLMILYKQKLIFNEDLTLGKEKYPVIDVLLHLSSSRSLVRLPLGATNEIP